MDADSKIAQVERKLAYTFANKMICAQAIQMAAAPQFLLGVNNQMQMVNNNKRLAILGDAVMTQILCKAWFDRKDQSGNPRSAADWTQIRQDTLSNAALADLGLSLGLGDAIVASPGHFGRPGTVMMATAFEALLGAVYQDGGEAAVKGVIEHIGL